MKSPVTRALAFLAISSSIVGYVGCSTDDAVHEAPPLVDGGMTTADGGVITPGMDGSTTADGSMPVDDCFTNPTTHFEIINACTDAARIDKKPLLPLLLADGGLPLPP
jgi:hypothetical protein